MTAAAVTIIERQTYQDAHAEVLLTYTNFVELLKESGLDEKAQTIAIRTFQAARKKTAQELN